MEKQSISAIIADYVLSLEYEDIPSDVIDHVKKLMVDSFGCIYASRNEEHISIIKNVLNDLPNSDDAFLWGSNEKMSIDNAALYNSSLVHGLDYDDTHAGSIIHPSASVLCCAITLADKYKFSGKEVITAMVAGYEVLLRLGNACKGKMHQAHFHPTGIFAPFATICVVGKLLKASKETIINAMGLAGSYAAAAQQYTVDGTWSKKMHPGWGIHSGLSAYRFAAAGYLGSPQIFEGTQGLYMAHIGTVEYLDEAFSDLGNKWLTKEIAFKFYPVCHMMHSHIDLVLKIVKENNIDCKDIKCINAVLSPRAASIVAYPVQEKKHPLNDYQMRFSIQYALAASAYYKYFAPLLINPNYVENKDLLELIEKVHVEDSASAEVPGHFPGDIEIVLNDGRVYHDIQKFEKGSLENPAKKEDVINKFYLNIKNIISKEQGDLIISYITKFDELDNMNDFIKSLEI